MWKEPVLRGQQPLDFVNKRVSNIRQQGTMGPFFYLLLVTKY